MKRFVFLLVILFSLIISGCFKRVPEKELTIGTVAAMKQTMVIDTTTYSKRAFVVITEEKSPIMKSFLLKESNKNFLIRVFTEKNITEGNKISGKDLRVIKFRATNTANESYAIIY